MNVASSCRFISNINSCYNNLFVSTYSNCVAVAHKCLKFLCQILESAQKKLNNMFSRISLPYNDELVKNDDGHIYVALLCHRAFVKLNWHTPIFEAVKNRYSQKGISFLYIEDSADGKSIPPGHADLLKTPNLFIISAGANELIQDNDGQYQSSGYLNAWKEKFHTDEKKSASVWIIDPVGSIPINLGKSYDASHEEHKNHISCQRILFKR